MSATCEVQPRFAAWLTFLGYGDATESNAKRALKLQGSWSYMAWISRRLREAAAIGAGVTDRDGSPRIVSHEAFTAYCEQHAQEWAA